MSHTSGFLGVAVLALLAVFCASSDIAVCPGESARYGDHKCNHDATHRVCATLLDSSGKPLSWGSGGDFWKITGQKAFQWDDQIRANHGDSWCICMWATARLIEAAGCDNVHLNCDATDVKYVMKAYQDGGTDLAPAHKCLQQKCSAAAAMQSKALLAPREESPPFEITSDQQSQTASSGTPQAFGSSSGAFGVALLMASVSCALIFFALVRFAVNVWLSPRQAAAQENADDEIE